jgi:O-antigen/teichoic acid export membrane protein
MPQKQGTVLGTALVMRLISSVLSFIMVVMVILVIEPDDKLIQAVTILQALAIIFQVYEVFTYWFQSKLKMKNVVIAIICALTAVGLWRVFLLAKGLSVQWFALAASIQYIVTGIVVIFFYFSDKESPKLRFNYLTSKRLFLKSYHFIVSGLAVTCYSQIDKIMIKKIIDNEAVGIYTIAVAISILWEFVPHALINSSRPLILEKRIKSYEEYIKSFQMLLLGITLLGVAVDFALIILGKPIIRLLYGDAYIGAFLPLCFLIFSTNFAIIGTARSIWIIAEGQLLH